MAGNLQLGGTFDRHWQRIRQGKSKSVRQRQRAVEALCARPEMSLAIRTVRPSGLGRNKQLVADLVRGGHFTLLTVMYRLKNRL